MKKQHITALIMTLVMLVGGFSLPTGALAEGGIAISGSLSQQELEVPQGSSASGPGINVVVFNNGSENLDVRMKTQLPPGVEVDLSTAEFTIPPGGNQQVLVGIRVSKDATPGDYELTVTAESYREGISGIQLAGAAQQTAKLKITGDAAFVTLRAMSLSGQPLVATIRLYRMVSGQRQEVAYTDEGLLEAIVAPGDYTVSCFIGGMEVAQQSFTIAADEEKYIELTAATVYFEGFSVVPTLDNETGKLSYMKIVYAVMNLYQRVENGEVLLIVTLDGVPQEPVSLANLSPLEKGRIELSYNYIPSEGWGNGTYDFMLQLNLDGKSYTTSQTQQFDADEAAGGFNLLLVIAIAAGALVLVILLIVLVRRFRSY